MNTMTRQIRLFTPALLLFTQFVGAQSVSVINMIPNGRSGEVNQDAEPTITVDPLNTRNLAGSAFTWDNLTGGPMVTNTAPIYVSKDGGTSWSMALIVPSAIGAGFPTGDINLSFGGSLSSATAHKTTWLYGGTLSSATAGRPMTVLRSADPFAAAVMATLDTRSGNVDQPHTATVTIPAGDDRLYVGFNNGYGCGTAPSGQSSTIDISADANATTPNFPTPASIDSRNNVCQDGFAQVPATHTDGTVYAAFIHDWGGSPRLVVVRDDGGAVGSGTRFADLKDPSDTKPGRFVTAAMTLPSGAMGQNRLGASNVSISVDPRDSDRVYVAWGDSGGPNLETIHVRRSINRGVDWSAADLVTVTSAMNPELAISDIGVVGLLYQQVNAGTWETHLVRSVDPDAVTFDTPGKTLAEQSASTPTAVFYPYIGDYASLTKLGRGFVGMFSTSNYPDKANFPQGISYQREVDWNSHTLFADSAHTQVVAPSIDPYFVAAPWSICTAIPGVCNICRNHPELCFPIYDPWWKFKCPACTIEILVNPGDIRERIAVYTDESKLLGTLHRLEKPVVERGIAYTYSFRVKASKGTSYVLRAKARGDLATRKQKNQIFTPAYRTRVLARD